jgi:hypothetical protein
MKYEEIDRPLMKGLLKSPPPMKKKREIIACVPSTNLSGKGSQNRQPLLLDLPGGLYLKKAGTRSNMSDSRAQLPFRETFAIRLFVSSRSRRIGGDYEAFLAAFRGTLLPSFRAFARPMAIACCLLFTLPPALPLLALPRL